MDVWDGNMGIRWGWKINDGIQGISCMEVLWIPISAANKTEGSELRREGRRANMLQLICYVTITIQELIKCNRL
jgi:hypothetical protein